jgi:hypothetical protein
MKPLSLIIAGCALLLAGSLRVANETRYSLEDRATTVAVDARGNLVSLINRATGHNYASGKPL